MNKVICDVCGTDYPETATQCPICGCARADGNQTSAGNTETVEEERAYTYVKGGRFSKSNVRKRLKANQVQQSRVPEPEYDDDDEDDEEEDEEGRSNWGLIAIVILLLLAIIAVSSYIAIVHFGLFDQADPTQSTTSATDDTGTVPSTSDVVRVPCTGLTITDNEINLASVDSVWELKATAEPVGTTDKITFVSSDENVATVDQAGRVTAVGSGEATITVSCGTFVVECKVICDFETESTDPTDPGDTTDPTDPDDSTEPSDPAEPSEPDDTVVLELRYDDVTLDAVFPQIQLYKGELDPAQIKWTSSKENVATVKDGLVTPVALGKSLITAEYEGQKATCWIRVSQAALDKLKPEDTEPTTEPTEPSETTDPTDPTETTGPVNTYSLMVNGSVSPFGDANNAEVSIKVGETFRLTVEDEMAAFQKVEWTMSKDGIVSYDNNKVNGLAEGTVTLTTTYEGQTFTCKIHVSEA